MPNTFKTYQFTNKTINGEVQILAVSSLILIINNTLFSFKMFYKTRNLIPYFNINSFLFLKST